MGVKSIGIRNRKTKFIFESAGKILTVKFSVEINAEHRVIVDFHQS